MINNESLTISAQLGVMRSVQQVESEVIAQSASQPSAVSHPCHACPPANAAWACSLDHAMMPATERLFT